MIMLRGKIDNQFGALLVAGAVLLVLAIPVRAQEMEVQETDVVDWTGPYLGVNSGLRLDDTKVDYAAIGNFEAVVRHSAVIGGAQFGYNEQLGGRWLIGFEGDAELSNQSASLILGPPSPPNFRCSPPDPQCRFSIFDTLKFTRSIKRSGDASTRLRAGFSWDSVLIYATAGIALANTNVRAQDSVATTVSTPQSTTVTTSEASGANSKNVLGWSLGLGGELSVNPNISIAFEYRRSDYGSHTYSFNPVLPGNGGQSIGTPSPTTVAMMDDRVTLRLNYHFRAR